MLPTLDWVECCRKCNTLKSIVQKIVTQNYLNDTDKIILSGYNSNCSQQTSELPATHISQRNMKYENRARKRGTRKKQPHQPGRHFEREPAR